MDIFRLDRTTFKPDKLLEGFDSKIWTERYIEDGDFELKTPYVSETMKLLPEMSLLSLRDSDQVMYVEKRLITKSGEGFPQLTVTGTSLPAFTEHRYLEGPYPKKKYKMARDYTAKDAALILLWNSFVNPSVNDVTRIGTWERSLLDTIPNTVVSDSTTVAGTAKRRWLEGGQVYSQMIDLLNQNHLGIRAIRPNSGPAKIATVTTNDKGIISYSTVSSTNQLRFDIYNGTDRTKGQSAVKPVIFHWANSDLKDPSYLFSIENFKTMAFVISSEGIRRIYRDKPNDANLAGLDRRVVWVDGGQPGDDESKADFLADLPEKGDVELEKHNRVHLMDGAVSPSAPNQYNRDYFLGDSVTLVGEYDFNQPMRVTEYVRTEDADGDRGYPGLVVIDE